MVEKWPIYFLPPFGCLNGFLFSNQCTAGRRTLEGRASAENAGGRSVAAGSKLAGSVIRRPFTLTRPGVNVLFLWGHQEPLQNMSRSGGGQSDVQCVFLSVRKGAYDRNEYEFKNCYGIWFKKK